MNELQRYAEMRRSGRYSDIGVRTESIAHPTSMDIGPHNVTVTAESPVRRKDHHPWIPWGLSLLLLIPIIYLLFFHPRAILKTQADEVLFDWKKAFFEWAYTDGNAIQADCRSERPYKKGYVILTGCTFTLIEGYRDASKIRLTRQ